MSKFSVFSTLLVFCCVSIGGAQITTAVEVEKSEEFTVELAEEPIRGTVDDFAITGDDIVVLYNNDVHGSISADKEYSGSERSLGYAGMAGVKEDVLNRAGDVTVVDLGDAIQGSLVTSESNGQAVMELMSEIGYDILVPGNHEFDYGMDNFLEYAAQTEGKFISCNFRDIRTGDPIFDGYKLKSCNIGGKTLTVGYVGITTPETLSKSTPTYFQDEDGNYIYDFNANSPQDLYDCVQANVNAAYKHGADVVIALGHLGDSGVEENWSSVSVIANTTGINVFLDGHAHNTIPCQVVQNLNGEDVLLSSTGTKLEHIGLMKMHVAEDNTLTISTGLIDKITDAEKSEALYADLYDMIQEIEDQYAYLFVKVGSTDFDLVVYDPETDDRLIRKSETNLGDFLSDVYRKYFNADIGLINGGCIRANIDAGDITYMDLITVYPWNTATGVVEVSGQVILDCLEMGAHLYPEECGGWIQPSGLTYMIDTTIPSNVIINSDGEFVSVDGEYRIKDVMVGDEPLDLGKTYTLAINTYYSLEYGDGMTMFKDCKPIIPAEGEDEFIDHDVVINYLNEIGGIIPEEYEDPYGQGRILIITEENKGLPQTTHVRGSIIGDSEDVEPETSDERLNEEDSVVEDSEDVEPEKSDEQSTKEYEYDFKTFKWGDSEERVREVEGENVIMEDDMSAVSAHYIAYETTVAGLEAILAYYFCDEGLYATRYILTEDHSNESLFIDDYLKIEGAITKKYGEPLFGGEHWDNDRHKEYYADDKGNALSYGYLTYSTWYLLPRTSIDMNMSADNFVISTTISYSSNTISPGDEDYSDDL